MNTAREGHRKVRGTAHAGPESTQHVEGFEVTDREGPHSQFFICQLVHVLSSIFCFHICHRDFESLGSLVSFSRVLRTGNMIEKKKKRKTLLRKYIIK